MVLFVMSLEADDGLLSATVIQADASGEPVDVTVLPVQASD